MVPDTILLRYGEIFLKGKNRNIFVKKLASNIKKITGKEAMKLQGRLLMGYFADHARLRNVFGLNSYSLAYFAAKDIEEIKKKTLGILLDVLKGKAATFRIETKRSDKAFSISSLEINASVGRFIENNSNLKFSFENADIVLKIEINQQGAYLFFETIGCFGGLPAGVEGKVCLLVEDQASLLAGLMMMKRGCSVVPVSFKEKDISLLQKFSPEKLSLDIIKNKDVIKSLDWLKDRIIVSGQNFEDLRNYSTNLTVMRPLISYSNEKIKEELGKFMV